MKLKIGIGLIFVSAISFLSIILIPFIEISVVYKSIVITSLVILGEISFYLGLFFIGKTVWLKYKERVLKFLRLKRSNNQL